jgi:glycerate 2-kinase
MGAPQYKDHEIHVCAMIESVREACDPSALVRSVLPGLPDFGGKSVTGIAVGKAALSMVAGIEAVLGPGSWHGPIAVPHGLVLPSDPRVVNGEVLLAGHPVPDAGSREAGRLLSSFVSVRNWQDGQPFRLWALLSGGASALVVDPPPEIAVGDYRAIVDALLRAGATIGELNTVRKHIDRVKGGSLAREAIEVPMRVLVLSDVIGDDVSIIASGPFAPDPTTYADAFDILMVYGCVDVASPVSTWLREGMRGAHPETPKPGDPCLDRVRHMIIGNNEIAARAASSEAARLGYHTPAPELLVQGEAAEVGRRLAAGARPPPTRRPACLIFGGETTVNVAAAQGKGGRNQELALAAAIEINGAPNVAIATFATDGADGPTDAAGAIVTGDTCARARGMGLDPGDFLARHDAYTFFEKAGGHIKTGPTGTNVNDLAIALVY